MARAHEIPYTKNDANKIRSVAPDFMFGSQIVGTHRYSRKMLSWCSDDKQVQKLLFKVFPKLKTDLEQRRRAGRWAMVIQLYFRAHRSYREVASDMGENPKAILTLTRSIARAQKGIPINGVKRKKEKRAIDCTRGGEQGKTL